MTELEQLEADLKGVFGCWTRYQNQVFEAHGTTATDDQKLVIGRRVLDAGNLGVAAHQYEAIRHREFGLS